MLEHSKKDVCEIARRAQKDGLREHKSGNFSARDAKSGYIVIIPISIDREMLTLRDMIAMDLDVNVLEHASGLRPTSEALMYSIICRTRKDVRAAVHTHSMYGTTFVLLDKPISAIVCEVANFGLAKARIPVALYGRLGMMELADSVVGVCKEAECFSLEKHGTVAFDTGDIYEVYLKANYTEELAQLYYSALIIHQGKEPGVFSQEELQCWEYPEEIGFADE